jgi:peptide/nickel transport system substrate-binding protein
VHTGLNGAESEEKIHAFLCFFLILLRRYVLREERHVKAKPLLLRFLFAFLIKAVIMLAFLPFIFSPRVSLPSDALRVALPGNPLTLNPLYIRDAVSLEVATLFHSPLAVAHPKTLEMEPMLLEGWDIATDGQTYTLRLRQGLHWSDGEPLTAKDVAFTLRIICHPDYTGWLYHNFRHIQGAGCYRANHGEPLASGEIEGLRVLDQQILEVRLSQPFAPFLSTLDLPPLPEHLLGSTAVAALESSMYSQTLPVGAGPFLLEEWKQEQYLRAKANEDYFLGSPELGELQLLIIPNQEAQLLELLAGKLDLIPMYAKVEDILQLNKDASLRVYRQPRLSYDYIGFNFKKEQAPWEDRQVRQALSRVLDPSEIVEDLLLGYGQVATGPFSPLHFAYRPENKQGGNPGRGRDVLSGLKLTLTYNAGNLIRENIALLFQEAAREVGMEVHLRPLEWEAFLACLNNGDFELALLGHGLGTDPDPTFYWHSESLGNFLGYQDPEVDRLLEAAVQSHDRAERTVAYQEINRILLEDAPVIWLYSREAVGVSTAQLEGFAPHPAQQFYNVHQWRLRN